MRSVRGQGMGWWYHAT